MLGMKLKLSIFFCFHMMASSKNTTGIKYLKPVICRPYVHYVETTQRFEHTPYVVKLFRCHGKTDSRQKTECVPKTTQNVTVGVVLETAVLGSVTMLNHTSCEEICQHNASICNKYQKWQPHICKCLCIQQSVPHECQSPFYWDQNHCNCRCPYDAVSYPCIGRKEFSATACGCMCKAKWGRKCSRIGKYLNATTCGCDNVPSPVTGTSKTGQCSSKRFQVILILVTVFEAIAISALFYLWNQYSDLIQKHCCSRRNENNMEFNVVKNCPADGEKSLSVTPTIDIQPLVDSPLSSRKAYCSYETVNAVDETDATHARHKYESTNVLPIFYAKEEKSQFTRGSPQKSSFVYYNDVSEQSSNDTFKLSDSLASVTQV